MTVPRRLSPQVAWPGARRTVAVPVAGDRTREGCHMRHPLMLKQPFGRNHNVDLDDSLSIKRALNSLGYYQIPRHGLTPYPDEALFKGIKAFQRDSRLRADGIMEPGGETAVALGESISRLNPTPSISSGSLLKSDALVAEPSSPDEAGEPKGTRPRGVQTAMHWSCLCYPVLPTY